MKYLSTLLLACWLAPLSSSAQDVLKITACTRMWSSPQPINNTQISISLNNATYGGPTGPGKHCINLEIPVAGLPDDTPFLGTALKDSSGLEDELMNGLSIADLAGVRCHIIGLHPLPNPYSMICADANQSGSITTYDIAEMSRGILGIYRVWPKGVKWIFMHKAYPPPDPGNPFNYNFPMSEPLSKLKTFHNDTLYVYGMKIGDMDGDVNTTGAYQPIKTFSDSLTLTFPDVVLPANTTLNVNATSSTLPKYQSMQIELVTQPGLRLVGMSPSYFSYHVLNDSTLRMLFLGSNAGSPTFTFQMATTQPVVLRDAIRIGTGIQAFALAGNNCAPPFKAIRPQLRFSGTLGAHGPSDRLLDAAPATPNPFRDYATITLHLEESTPAHVEVFDTSGRLTWQQHCQLGSGEQQVILPADALPLGGLGFYRISTPQGIAQGKVVRE